MQTQDIQPGQSITIAFTDAELEPGQSLTALVRCVSQDRSETCIYLDAIGVLFFYLGDECRYFYLTNKSRILIRNGECLGIHGGFLDDRDDWFYGSFDCEINFGN